jgi:hypothetical protein
MKPLAAAVLALSLVAGIATSALAQTTGFSPNPGRASAPPPDPAAPATPAPPAPPTGVIERPAADDPAALPRAPMERTTIFGLSPVAAVIVAASLLVVVVLAVVAMTRSNTAYIDLDRRE